MADGVRIVDVIRNVERAINFAKAARVDAGRAGDTPSVSDLTDAIKDLEAVLARLSDDLGTVGT